MNLSYITTYSEWFDWSNKVAKLEVVAFDTETESLRYGSKIIGLSLCNGIEACYINLSGKDDSERSPIIGAIMDIFETETKLLVGHNISYDLRVLKLCEIEPTCNLYDTMVACHLLNENAKCGLKDVAARKLGYKDPMTWKEAIKFGYDSKGFAEYGIGDAIKTWQLYELTKPLIDKGGFTNLFYNIEMPFQRVIVDLETNGIGIDQEYLKHLDDTLAAQKVLLEECFEPMIGRKINLNSGQQVAKVIQEDLGIKLPNTKPSKRHPKGQPSTKSQVLEPLRKQHKFINTLLDYRKVEKLWNTFVHPMWEKIYEDGRVRPSFNDCIARTGRLSSSNPNGQNIPSPKKRDSYGIRKMFKARDGYVLIQGDWSGQELRGCAHVSGDKNMIESFLADKDLHLATANEWLKLEIPDEKLYKAHPEYKSVATKYEKERDRGKNGVNFPIVYGTTAKGISFRQGIDEELAAAGIEAFFKLYPGVRAAVRKCKKDLFEHHCVVTMLGRKRRFGIINDKAIRQAFNFLIQGFFADVLRIAMSNIRQLFIDNPQWDAKLVLTVHDSITAEAKKECAEEVSKEMQRVMESSYKLSIPLPADMIISQTLK
jgi:DNA polymerase I